MSHSKNILVSFVVGLSLVFSIMGIIFPNPVWAGALPFEPFCPDIDRSRIITDVDSSLDRFIRLDADKHIYVHFVVREPATHIVVDQLEV